MTLLRSALLLLQLLCLAACDGSASEPVRTPGGPPAAPSVAALAEGSGVGAVLPGASASIDAGTRSLDLPPARSAVAAAISRAALQLAAVDYSSLSLPAFAQVTRSAAITAGDFAGGEIWLEGSTPGGGGTPALIYGWRGRELPQLAARPLVHRWVGLYAVWDTGRGLVTKLVATVLGEVHEQ